MLIGIKFMWIFLHASYNNKIFNKRLKIPTGDLFDCNVDFYHIQPDQP